MSQNDLLHLEANFNNWSEERAPGLKRIQPFLYYCIEQFLKVYDLSDEEIRYGIVDGANDGGVDAVYFIVNRDLLVRDDIELEFKGISKVRLVIVQVKGDEGFSPMVVDKLLFFTDDLLDLSAPVAGLTHKYNPQLLKIMRLFKEKYLLIAGRFPSVTVDYYYITKGDEVVPNATVLDSVARLKTKSSST